MNKGLRTILIIAVLVGGMFAASAASNEYTYNTKKAGYWQLQFSDRGNDAHKLSPTIRNRLMAKIAPYYGIGPDEYDSFPREVFSMELPMTKEDRAERECMIKMLNYASDVLFNRAPERDLNTICA